MIFHALPSPTFSRAIILSVLASNQNMNSNDQMGHHYIDPHSKGSKPVENHHFDHLHVEIFTIKQSKDACEIQAGHRLIKQRGSLRLVFFESKHELLNFSLYTN